MPNHAYKLVFENYKDNFSLLHLLMVTSSEYQAEMPYFRKITQTATYSHNEKFSCTPVNKPKFHYCFTAKPEQILKYRLLTPFLAAHEFFHALRHQKFLDGERNTKYYSGVCSKMMAKNANNIEKIAASLANLNETNEEETEKRIKKENAFLDLSLMHNQLSLTLYNINAQAEEFACDQFALKMFPGTDLDMFEHFLGEDFEPDPEEVERHPANKERISRLRQQQKYILG